MRKGIPIVALAVVLGLGGCKGEKTDESTAAASERTTAAVIITTEPGHAPGSEPETAESRPEIYDKLLARVHLSLDEAHFPDESFRDYMKNTFDTDEDGILHGSGRIHRAGNKRHAGPIEPQLLPLCPLFPCVQDRFDCHCIAGSHG